MKVLLLAHYDFADSRGKIADLLPVDEIIEYGKKNGYWIVEAYCKEPVTNFENIKDINVCNWFHYAYPQPLQSKFFEDCEIILTGGYRSLCLKHFFDCLNTKNHVIINPDWVVSDPSYINSDAFPLWDYAEADLLA